MQRVEIGVEELITPRKYVTHKKWGELSGLYCRWMLGWWRVPTSTGDREERDERFAA